MVNDIRTYETVVLKNKQEDFLNFLRGLGIKREELDFKTNGDYFLYTIDLSEKDNSSLSLIRHELNETQVEFL